MASYSRWKCSFCDQSVTYNGIATAAHYKKHLRQLGIKKYDSNRRMEALLRQAVKDGRWPPREASNG